MTIEGKIDDKLGRMLEDLEKDNKRIRIELDEESLDVIYYFSSEGELPLFTLYSEDRIIEYREGINLLEERNKLLKPLIKYFKKNNWKTNLE